MGHRWAGGDQHRVQQQSTHWELQRHPWSRRRPQWHISVYLRVAEFLVHGVLVAGKRWSISQQLAGEQDALTLSVVLGGVFLPILIV